jgi:integrase/recombinase XerD
VRQVKMPRLDKRILPAFSPDVVRRLLSVCGKPRDAAIVLCLLDSGLWASEFVALDVADVEVKTGAVHVRRGKGRVAFLGAKATTCRRRTASTAR